MTLHALQEPQARPPWWRRWLRPTLGRRLLLAQMGVLTVIWTALLVATFYMAHFHNELLASDPVYELVMAVAEDLADLPDRQQHSLAALDTALRHEYGDGEDDNRFTPSLLVWQEGQLIFRSPTPAPTLRNRVPGKVEDIDAGNQTWRMRTLSSPSGRTEVTLMLPSFHELLINLNTRSYYLLPLLISLPFLAFPAWWSVRAALRPLRRVGDELATRGPDDLSALTYSPPHSELRPLVQDINALLARVRSSSERERNLIADAAHELRTPLAAMHVNVEAMLRHGGEPHQQELMDSLLRSNQRASRMVAQLLQLMRSETDAPGMAMQPLRLDLLLEDRLAALDALACRRPVELALEASEPLSVMGEREGLVSLIDNLVDNAIKYSPAHATISVRLQRRGDQAVLQVRDRGPGIAEAWRQRVFDRFFRVPDQSQSGSGLGLAIARTVTQRHGGSIELHNAQDGGLLASVSLPVLQDAG
ncbi:sensor histidine kinase [Delftia acidovorans]|uniref:sensor histidine kinase n=1 Tax=Delftia acidovorans TaxID=80866 RepID=UPI00301A1E1E